MSLPAALGIGALVALMLASLCYVFRVPWIHGALARINWFRLFAHWTMFAAHPDSRLKPGVFVVEYRDGRDGPWVVALDGHHWTPYSFLASPRRLIAARAHYLGQALAVMSDGGGGAEVEAEVRDRETLIANCLRRLHPGPPGQLRTIRIVKRPGRDVREGRVVRQFEVAGDA